MFSNNIPTFTSIFDFSPHLGVLWSEPSPWKKRLQRDSLSVQCSGPASWTILSSTRIIEASAYSAFVGCLSLTPPTFVSLLLESMINLFEGVGDKYSIVLVGNQLWHRLAQRHSITSEEVPWQCFMILGWGWKLPVEKPTVLGNDPKDRVRADTCVKQLKESVQPSFSCTNHHIPATFLETTFIKQRMVQTTRSSEHVTWPRVWKVWTGHWQGQCWPHPQLCSLVCSWTALSSPSGSRPPSSS